MKIKVAIASLAVVGIAVVAFAFTPKKVAKKLSPVTFYYVISKADQRIESGFTTVGVEHSMQSASFTNQANWSTTPQGADTYGNDGSSYLKSFTIDNFETTKDGDDDGAINLQEALEGIDLQYVQSSLYPSTSDVVTVNAPMSGSGTASLSNFTRADNANVQ